MIKNIGIFLAFVISTGIVFLVLISRPNKTPEEILNNKSNIKTQLDIRGSFAIYTNGTFRVFTDSMYHNLSDDAFIESSNPNIVNVNKEGITWKDFFSTLPFSIDENCLITGTKQTFCTNDNFVLQFFLNGKRNQKALNQIIKTGDKLLVTYEAEGSPKLETQVNSVPDLR